MQLCGFEVGLNRPLFLIAGPCVIESEQMALDTAGQLKEIAQAVGMPFIYKSSYDKANRSSGASFRGLAQPVQQQAPVGQAGERVVERQPHRPAGGGAVSGLEPVQDAQ